MASWNTYSTPSTGSETINDQICVGPNAFVAVGTAGTVIYSTDGGQTWSAGTGLDANFWSGLAFDGTTVCVVGQTGSNRVGTSTDGGATWTMHAASEANSWLAVCAPAAGTFVAVAADGTHRVMKSTDSGATWTNKTAASANQWGGVASNDDGSRLVAVDTTGPMAATMTSTDAGDTWSAGGVPANFQSVVAQGTGSNVVVYSTVTGTFTVIGWNTSTFVTSVATSTDAAVWSVAAITGYAGGSGGFIAADAWGGFIGSLPFDAVFAATPTIIGNSADGGSTWTAEDSTFSSSAWGPAAWDDSTGTFVAWDTDKTDTMLVGIFAIPSIDGISPDHGPTAGGTSVTITGEHLQSVVDGDILIGGVAATSVTPAVDGLSLTCDTPAHAGGIVDVELVGGNTLEDAFTYQSVESCRPNLGPIVGGQIVIIRGYGLDLATSVKFDGITVPTDQWEIVNARSIRAITPAHIGTGVVDVEVGAVGTGTGIYEYNATPLPPIPPIAETTLHPDVLQWMNEFKKRWERGR